MALATSGTATVRHAFGVGRICPCAWSIEIQVCTFFIFCNETAFHEFPISGYIWVLSWKFDHIPQVLGIHLAWLVWSLPRGRGLFCQGIKIHYELRLPQGTHMTSQYHTCSS